ncbi:MAG: hypothetical protein ACD_7C00498G0001 [uncultured bacterium]|nr:MAG: hypothetical protein ACD_7C00498G0001 [uncultured bacterium]
MQQGKKGAALAQILKAHAYELATKTIEFY